MFQSWKKINALLNFLLRSLDIKHKVTQTGGKSRMDVGEDKVWFKTVSPRVPLASALIIISSPSLTSNVLHRSAFSQNFPPVTSPAEPRLLYEPRSPDRLVVIIPVQMDVKQLDSHFIPTLCSNLWIKLWCNFKMSIFSLLTPSHQPTQLNGKLTCRKSLGKQFWPQP